MPGLGLVVAGLVGAALVNRRRPQSRVHKRECYGPRTGATYQVEDFPDARLVSVSYGRAGTAYLLRNQQGVLQLRSYQGDPRLLEAIKKDFLP